MKVPLWLILMAAFAIFLALVLSSSSCSKNQETIVPDTTSGLQVWLHRVNSIEKAIHFRDQFQGYELDVHYIPDSGTFFVKHDAETPDTMKFIRWLAGFPHPEGLSYWLDFKNLQPDIAPVARAELIRICSLFGLTRRIVVESSSPESVILFDTLNFLPSFYIPTFDPSSITPDEESYYQGFINDRVQQYGLRTISGYSMQLPFMQKWFPQLHKLTWYLDSTDPAIQDSIIAGVRKDTTVWVVLISENFSPLAEGSGHPQESDH
jgi:hypothetical protein